MKVYINPGHDIDHDPGAVNLEKNAAEAKTALKISNLVAKYLNAVGIETKILQSDNLYWDSIYSDRPIAVVEDANNWNADIFISIHCNSATNKSANGTETLVYNLDNGKANILADCVQKQIVNSLNTTNRGLKEYPSLIVLKYTYMPAILVETAFISNSKDCDLLLNKVDDFARAIARGVTDYQLKI